MAPFEAEVKPLRPTICRLCGGPVLWHEDGGKKVPLDAHEVAAGEHRYAVTPDGLVEVPEGKAVMAYTDHRDTCPYYARNPNFRR